jgi:hypothetical protein
MKPILPILALLSLSACTNLLVNNDVKVPDQVKITKSNKSRQIPGTRIFTVLPEGYHLNVAAKRIEKDTNNYIQFYEMDHTNYKDINDRILDNLANSPEGKQVKYTKHFMLGGDSAMFIYGSVLFTNEQMIMTLGNNNYAALVTCVLKGGKEDRDKALNTFLNTYIDSTVTPDARDVAVYTVDVSKSAFKFNGLKDQIFYYTLNGAPIDNSELNDKIMVLNVPATDSYEERKRASTSFVDQLRAAGIRVDVQSTNKIIQNGEEAYEIKLTADMQGRKATMYLLTMGNNNGTVVFIGEVFDDNPVLLPDMRNVASTFRLK